ncbi:DUF559 domain-containing protein [Jatrophihabitans sp.]|uniref:DUF559 domain-containing protein n=1 Tax=Jatrophihabitans sp. TaxID=1932789 RepID=UPI0030C74C0C|nr:hypothetical protein [Jatrophihabitans sp.]
MTWAVTARAQAGVITRTQLRDAGLTDDQINILIRTAALVPLWRGIHIVRGAPLTYDARLWAAVLGLDGILGFGTAAHLWGVTDRPDCIEVIIPRAAHRWRHPEVRTHRIDVAAGFVTTRNGLPVTVRRETLLDHIGRLRPSAARQLADRAVQRGWLVPADFESRVSTQPGRIGNTLLRELGAMVSDGAAATSERVLHRLLRRAGLTGWDANVDVWCDGELVAVLDVGFRRVMLAVEIDGLAHHHTPDRFQRDRTRQNRLVGLGWTVLRFTWSDLVDRPGYVVATIRHHLRNSGSEAG